MGAHIIPGKKSASCHLVAVVIGLKTMQSGKERHVKLSKPKIEGNIRGNGKIDFFSIYDTHLCKYFKFSCIDNN